MSYSEENGQVVLTESEICALQALADGQIASLALVGQACDKLGCSSLTNAVATALRRGLID